MSCLTVGELIYNYEQRIRQLENENNFLQMANEELERLVEEDRPGFLATLKTVPREEVVNASS